MNALPPQAAPVPDHVDADALAVKDLQAISDAVHRAQAVIECDLHGRVLTANRNFLDLMGFTLPEVQGKRFGCPATPTTPRPVSTWSSGAAR